MLDFKLKKFVKRPNILGDLDNIEIPKLPGSTFEQENESEEKKKNKVPKLIKNTQSNNEPRKRIIQTVNSNLTKNCALIQNNNQHFTKRTSMALQSYPSVIPPLQNINHQRKTDKNCKVLTDIIKASSISISEVLTKIAK